MDLSLLVCMQLSLKATNSQAQCTGIKTELNVKWPTKVTQGHIFLDQWKGDDGLHVLYNNGGLTSKGSEDIVSKSTENSRRRQPHCCLTSHLQGTSANIHINLILLETRVPHLHFCHR